MDKSLSSCKAKIEWLERVNKDLLEACKVAKTWLSLTASESERASVIDMLNKAIAKTERRE